MTILIISLGFSTGSLFDIIIRLYAIVFNPITDEHAHDSKAARTLQYKIENNILRIFGNRGYDSKYIYNIFGSGAIIYPRKNASTKSRGSAARAKIARFVKRNSIEQWKDDNNYVQRQFVELYFSGLKGVMSEVIKA